MPEGKYSWSSSTQLLLGETVVNFQLSILYVCDSYAPNEGRMTHSDSKTEILVVFTPRGRNIAVFCEAFQRYLTRSNLYFLQSILEIFSFSLLYCNLEGFFN